MDAMMVISVEDYRRMLRTIEHQANAISHLTETVVVQAEVLREMIRDEDAEAEQEFLQ